MYKLKYFSTVSLSSGENQVLIYTYVNKLPCVFAFACAKIHTRTGVYLHVCKLYTCVNLAHAHWTKVDYFPYLFSCNNTTNKWILADKNVFTVTLWRYMKFVYVCLTNHLKHRRTVCNKFRISQVLLCYTQSCL